MREGQRMSWDEEWGIKGVEKWGKRWESKSDGYRRRQSNEGERTNGRSKKSRFNEDDLTMSQGNNSTENKGLDKKRRVENVKNHLPFSCL